MLKLFQKTTIFFLVILGFSLILADNICGYQAEADITVTSKTGEKKSFQVGIADTAIKHENGLMHCHELRKGTGLFFIFNSDSEHFFWMKNTKIELAIIYIDKNFKVVSVRKGEPMSEKTLPSIYPCRYVLEINWEEGKNIVPDDKVTFRIK